MKPISKLHRVAHTRFGLSVIPALALLGFSISAHGAAYTWINGTQGLWNEEDNWVVSGSPTAPEGPGLLDTATFGSATSRADLPGVFGVSSLSMTAGTLRGTASPASLEVLNGVAISGALVSTFDSLVLNTLGSSTWSGGVVGGVNLVNATWFNEGTLRIQAGVPSPVDPLRLMGDGQFVNDAGGQVQVLTLSPNVSIDFINEGELVIAGASYNQVAATLVLDGGLVTLDVSGGARTLSIGAGAALTGDGDINRAGPPIFGANVAIAVGALLSPGLTDGEPGTIDAAGTRLSLDGAYHVDLTGTSPADYDRYIASQIQLTSGASTLSINSTGGPYPVGTVFTILEGNVTGIFTGRPNNSTVNLGGQQFVINYSSSGVTLSLVGARYVWIAGRQGLWTGDANWTITGVPSGPGGPKALDAAEVGGAGSVAQVNGDFAVRSFLLTGGRLLGTVVGARLSALEDLTVSGPATKTLEALTLRSLALGSWQGGLDGDVILAGGATWNNSGLLALWTELASPIDPLFLSGNGTFVNAPGSEVVVTSLSPNVFSPFINRGTLRISGRSYFQLGGALVLDGGVVVLTDNRVLSVAGTGSIIGAGAIIHTGSAVGTLAIGVGGKLSPGSNGGVGTIDASGNQVSLHGEYVVNINGVGLQDRVAATRITLTSLGSKLTVNNSGGNYAPGTAFTILTGTIVGTFKGLPNNATFVAGGETFRINYAANSVTLTAL